MLRFLHFKLAQLADASEEMQKPAVRSNARLLL